MTTRDHTSSHYHHGAERRRRDTLVTTVQALFGGSVIYRVFAHFMKEPEFEAQVMRALPKDKLPLIAAGVAAAGAIGLVSQRSRANDAEKSLAKALDEMTAEAEALRQENYRWKRRQSAAPRPRIEAARYDDTLTNAPTRVRTPR